MASSSAGIGCRRRDRGSVLPIVLVVSVVLAVVVVAVAEYSATTLRYGGVVEDSADRLATANGAMDNALEEFERGASACTLTALAIGGGYTYTLADTINGMFPTVTCQVVGGQLNVVDALAAIVTGEGVPAGDPLLLVFNGGGSENARKTLTGPVYLAREPSDTSMDLDGLLTIREGDLWYTNSVCPTTPTLPSRLTISPDGYGTRCRTESWLTLFADRKPPVPDNLASLPTGTASPGVAHATANGTCYVWEPGYYAAVPSLAANSYNYFRSGVYYFASGQMDISKRYVQMGHPGDDGPSLPGDPDSFTNNPCYERWHDPVHEPDALGASVYLGGDARFYIPTNGGSLEISGRTHAGYSIGVQALEPGDPGFGESTVGLSPALIYSDGNNADVAVHGLVWAPYAWVDLRVVNSSVGALTGGVVVAKLTVGTPANTPGFVLSVQTQPSTIDYAITTTAVNDGSTQVRTYLTYRTDGFYELTSRRVVGLTPE
jgi:hypothetical protein